MNLQSIIFSKDRPLQVCGTLESFRVRCQEASSIPIAVIYRASSAEYADGYEQLKREFSGKLLIEWVEESDFKSDVIRHLSFSNQSKDGLLGWILGHKLMPRHDSVLFMVDDNIFVRDFSMQKVLSVLDVHPSAIGFSLRVGKNTHYCYSNRCGQAFPTFTTLDAGMLEFNWPGSEGDFGYPLEVSSSVYRTKDLLPLLRNLPYNNPNRLEQGLSVSSRLFSRRNPNLLCFDQSVAFCVPVNKVQNILDNRAGNMEEYSSEALNRLFLDGSRIDVEKLNGFIPESAHQEIELPLYRSVS